MTDGDKVIPLLRRRNPLEGVPEPQAPTRPSVRVIQGGLGKKIADLSGKPKLWLLIGPGNSGKTTYARWLIDRQHGQDKRPALAAVDPGQRALVSWYGETVTQPPAGSSTAEWLRNYLDDIIGLAPDIPNCLVDFGGGGEPALRAVMDEIPRLHNIIEDAGIGLVAAYFLTPRLDDIFIPDGFAKAGFEPAATMLIMNRAATPSSMSTQDAFALVTQHSAYRRAIDRGAVPIWLPRLHSYFMEQIDYRRPLPFSMVRHGKVPEGAGYAPLLGFRQSATIAWLDAMEAAHADVLGWLE